MNRKVGGGNSSSRLLKDFQVEKVLGMGAYGAVLQVSNYLDKKSYAVKVVAGDTSDALIEVQNLVQVPNHRNVVQYHICWEDTFSEQELKDMKQKLNIAPGTDYFNLPVGQRELNVLCIQMELCGEDLRNWMGRQKTVDEGAVVNIFIQIAKGLEHIHQHDIIHRDLKPDNIFLGHKDKSIVLIGDLGIATEHTGIFSAAHTKKMGTPLYLAPEQHSNRYGKPADIYALGIILFELLNPKIQPSANGGSYNLLAKSVIDLKFQGLLPPDITTRWPKISQLLLKMLKVNPSERPTFKEIFDSFKSPKPQQTNAPTATVQVKKLVKEPKQTPPANVNPIPFKALNLGNTCAKCNQLITGSVTNAMDKTWHPEHFQCAHCNTALLGKTYYPKNDKPYCEKDYFAVFGKKCAHCNQYIKSNYTTAFGKTYHVDHFLCAHCRKPFNDKSYWTKNDKPYCDADYLELFAPKCACCKKPISKESYTTTPGLSWHNNCFVCSVCKKSVKGGYHISNNTLFCTEHFKS